METIVLIIAAFITSAISAVIGMGGGIILLGIMAIMIPEGYMVIALHGIIQLFSNTTLTYSQYEFDTDFGINSTTSSNFGNENYNIGFGYKISLLTLI